LKRKEGGEEHLNKKNPAEKFLFSAG